MLNTHVRSSRGAGVLQFWGRCDGNTLSRACLPPEAIFLSSVRESLCHLESGTVSQRIGLLGGTFDPPHRGHVSAATAVREQLGLDEVIVMVANDPWQKTEAARAPASAALRLEMTRAALEGAAGLVAGDAEIVRGGASYTVDTVTEIRRTRPGADVWVIVGADTASAISSWRDYRTLAASATMVAVTRPGHPLRDHSGVQWQVVEISPVEISSTAVRRRIADGESGADLAAAGWLHPAVGAIIDREGLYRPGGVR